MPIMPSFLQLMNAAGSPDMSPWAIIRPLSCKTNPHPLMASLPAVCSGTGLKNTWAGDVFLKLKSLRLRGNKYNPYSVRNEFRYLST